MLCLTEIRLSGGLTGLGVRIISERGALMEGKGICETSIRDLAPCRGGPPSPRVGARRWTYRVNLHPPRDDESLFLASDLTLSSGPGGAGGGAQIDRRDPTPEGAGHPAFDVDQRLRASLSS